MLCCQFAAYLKAIVTNSLGPLSLDTREGRSSNTAITATTQLQQNVRAREWGELAPQHMLESFRNCSLNLDNQAIVTLAVKLNIVSK
jgi:hypothetical protein